MDNEITLEIEFIEHEIKTLKSLIETIKPLNQKLSKYYEGMLDAYTIVLEDLIGPPI